jgi:hypothetical protein
MKNGKYTLENGGQEWYVNSQLHRLDGPAIIYPDGRQEWWVNSQLHRLDGPAIIYPDGRQEWWVNGHNITTKVEEWLDKTKINHPFNKDDLLIFALTFG